MVRLSKQQLVDCSWGSGNHGCKGGHYAAALSWVYVHGISTAKSYGKYLGQVRSGLVCCNQLIERVDHGRNTITTSNLILTWKKVCQCAAYYYDDFNPR